MSLPFTRSQLVTTLLQEISTAQASFQAVQLNAWRGVAPEAAPPDVFHLAGVEELELGLTLKPYRKPWPIRLLDWILRRREAGEQTYCFTDASDPKAISLRLRVARGKAGYEASTDPDNAMGEVDGSATT